MTRVASRDPGEMIESGRGGEIGERSWRITHQVRLTDLQSSDFDQGNRFDCGFAAVELW